MTWRINDGVWPHLREESNDIFSDYSAEMTAVMRTSARGGGLLRY